METKFICKRDYKADYACNEEIKKQIDNADELDVLALKIDNNEIIRLVILNDNTEKEFVDIFRNGL